MPSSQNRSLNTPAVRWPLFACTQCICICRFFNQARLKNHTWIKHAPVTSQPPSSLAYKSPSTVSPQPSGDEEQQPHFLHPPLVEVNSHDIKSVHTSSPAETFYDLPMNNDVIQWSVFDYDANHVDNLPNYNLNSTTSHISTPISIPCNPFHTPQNHVCQKEPTNNKHFQKLYHRKLSGKLLMVWYLEDSTRV